MASYHVPSYKTWASEMISQPQQYGTDGVVSRRKPMKSKSTKWDYVPAARPLSPVPVVDLDVTYKLRLGNQIAQMTDVRQELYKEIVEQKKEIENTSVRMVDVLKERNAVEKELLRRRGLEASIIDPEDLSYVHVGRRPSDNRIVHRHRPWYRRPLAPLERAVRQRRLNRQMMEKIELPSRLLNKSELKLFNDAEFMRVQDVFDAATPSQLRKILKDPYYLNFYRGTGIPDFM